MTSELLGVLATLAVWLTLGTLLGRYVAAALQSRAERGSHHWSDRAFGWIEKPIARLSGFDPNAPMTWKQYTFAMLASNLLMCIPIYVGLCFLNKLPLNPDGNPGMTADLA